MFALRCVAAFVSCTLPAWGATFGSVVPVEGGGADIILDEARGQIYLTSSFLNQVQVYSLQSHSLLPAIPTDRTPLSAALSRDGKFLYVTCFDSLRLDVIDLDALALTGYVGLPAKPEAVAVGSDGRVLISTSGSGTGGAANVLLVYDPSPTAAAPLSTVQVAIPAPTPPTLPPPAGRPFLSSHSQLAATRDGSTIVGVNVPPNGNPTVFVYEAASATVLRARIVAGSSNVLSISDDGSRFLSGPNLFDTTTLQVLARQNLANAPYAVPTGSNVNLAATQGGGVFSPDGQTLYSAFDISPVQTPPAPANVSQLMLNDPDNLLIRMGIQLPENLAGKMVMSSDGSAIYALSDSGFTMLPVGAISQSPLAVPDASVALLTRDQCAVTASTSIATVNVNDPGRGRITATAQLLQVAGQTNGPSPATAPAVRPSAGPGGAALLFSYNAAAAARGLGTISPPHEFIIQSPEAINIPNRVRVYENNRDSDARGTIVPIPLGGVTGEAFPDLVYDQPRQRLYIANPGLNRVEVYDIHQQQFLAPIKVGQLPISLALTPDGQALYVANSGGESISIIDPDKLQTIGRVNFPPIPFNQNVALATPAVIAAGLSGPQILMINGATASIWKIVGNTAVPRGASKIIGQTNTGLPLPIPYPSSMAATPGGEYILLATNAGAAYLYDATVDDFVANRPAPAATPTPQAGYIGPIAAGPKGQYYVVNGALLNQALGPVAGRAPVGLVSAVAAVGNSSYAVFSPPPAAAGNAPSSGTPTVQILDTATGSTRVQANALEGPLTQVTGTTRVPISGRTMAIDSSGTVAYVVTISGLSIVPLTPVAAGDRPQLNARAVVSIASNQAPVAANSLVSISGQNLATVDNAPPPLPTILGGTCVTLNNVPLPLLMTSPTQINAQIPPDMAAGSYPLVVRSLTKQAASISQTVTVSKYAPAVLVDNTGQPALFHADGTYVTRENPASRDEPLTMYALGLGPTTGGRVTAGVPSPSDPLAIVSGVQVFFGDPTYKQAPVIVDWAGLTPGWVGLYQLNLRVPGFHMKGDQLLITIRVGSVNSPSTGPLVPYVAVQ